MFRINIFFYAHNLYNIMFSFTAKFTKTNSLYKKLKKIRKVLNPWKIYH